MVQLVFPQTDIPEMVVRLQRHNAGSPAVLVRLTGAQSRLTSAILKTPMSSG